MKISNITVFNKKNKTNNTNFRGTPQRIPHIQIRDYADALKCWEYLKYAKYIDAHDKAIFSNKQILKENFSFLDKLSTNYDKSQFIQKFCEFTKFPNLKATCDNMRSTFDKCLADISRKLNYSTSNSPYKVLDWGYDPTCSLGLNKSFPGSDLDKGYIILEGNSTYLNDKQIVGNFSGELWNSLDQRIVSLNHPDTYPSIYTKDQIRKELNFLDGKAKEIEDELMRKAGFGLFAGLTIATLFGPLGIIGGCAIAGKILGEHFAKPYNTTDPYDAAKFNREIAKKISSSQNREDAKNFAFFIETVRENLDKNSYYKTDSIFTEIKNSPFATNSNVTQIPAWKNRINDGYLKDKLRNREHLESDFYKMDTDTKYSLIKEIIRYSSDEQLGLFPKYFKNDDDIAERYQRLIRSLK